MQYLHTQTHKHNVYIVNNMLSEGGKGKGGGSTCYVHAAKVMGYTVMLTSLRESFMGEEGRKNTEGRQERERERQRERESVREREEKDNIQKSTSEEEDILCTFVGRIGSFYSYDVLMMMMLLNFTSS